MIEIVVFLSRGGKYVIIEIRRVFCLFWIVVWGRRIWVYRIYFIVLGY